MMVPPSGWRFLQGEHWIKAQTFSELCANVTSHRQNNGLEAGNPPQEIQDQICSNYPETCLDKSPPPPKKVSTFVERFKSFAGTLLAHVKAGGELVDQNTANIRGEICRSCHNNVESAEAKGTGCRTCSTEDMVITALRKQILAGKTTPSNPHLKTCKICGCDIKLAIWFKRETLGVNKDNENAYTSFCWKKSA